MTEDSNTYNYLRISIVIECLVWVLYHEYEIMETVFNSVKNLLKTSSSRIVWGSPL